MKALTLEGYGGPASLRHSRVDTPPLGPRDVLIGVRAASINPFDMMCAQGALRERFNPTLPHVLGRDCSGVVEALGDKVTEFGLGDEVYAVADPLRWGTHAEKLAVDCSTVARKPETVDHVRAASLPISGLSTLAGLLAAGSLEKGERALIHAGAGGVGSLAVQFAKHIGAFVATTARAENLDFVRELGADIAIDYRQADLSAELKDFDIVFDLVGGDVRYRSLHVLRPGGRLVHLSTPPMKQPMPRDDVTVTHAVVSYQTKHLDQLAKLVDAGAIRPVVGRVFPFGQAEEAYAAMQIAGARGKIVIDMSGE